MPQKIIEATREHAPELLNGEQLPLPKGKQLEDMADKLDLPAERPKQLNQKQKRIQQLIGSLKFVGRLHPRLTLVLHRLSCVMSCPPPEAWEVARAALAAAYAERDIGITYGGRGLSLASRLQGDMRAEVHLDGNAPSALEAHADATWGDRNIYGLILTFGGAAVLHQTKKIALIVDSSMETEAIASSKGAEAISYAREILRGLGIPPDGPTLITTDNLSNQRVGSGLGCPTRSKHFLRRYQALKQRIQSREVTLRHINDADMPADFLTKWVKNAKKLEESVRYATNPLPPSSSLPESDRGECWQEAGGLSEE